MNTMDDPYKTVVICAAIVAMLIVTWWVKDYATTKLALDKGYEQTIVINGQWRDTIWVKAKNAEAGR